VTAGIASHAARAVAQLVERPHPAQQVCGPQTGCDAAWPIGDFSPPGRRDAGPEAAGHAPAASASSVRTSRSAPSGGLRNVLVHSSVDLDVARLVAVPLATEQYAEYVRQVARWVADRNG